MSSLTVTICASPNRDECSAQVSGSTQHLITDAEKKIFHATDLELKTQIEAWLGEKCDGAWPTDPTYGAAYPDLHHHFNWDEVKVNLNALSATIVDFKSVPEVISVQDFTNTLSTDMAWKCEFTQKVTSTVENTWSSSDSLGVEQMINYQIGFLGTGAEGETSINYTHEWGQEKTESKSYPLGLAQSVDFKLSPSKSAQVQFVASRGTLKVEIKYRATLQGSIAAFFKKKCQDRHYWFFDINNIKQISYLNTDFDYSEIIEVGFFSDSQVDIKINENKNHRFLSRGRDFDTLLDIMFRKADKDKNGLISKDEFADFLRYIKRPFDPLLLDLLYRTLGDQDGNLNREVCYEALWKLLIENQQHAQP